MTQGKAPVRIAVVGPTYPFRGGISRYNTLLCEHLRERNEVTLFSFRRQYPRWLYPGVSDRDPSCRPLRTPNVPMLDPQNPLTWWLTARRVVAAQPDLLLLHWWVTFWALPFAVIAGWASHRGVPVLYLCHNVFPHERKRWDTFLTRLAMSPADRFVVMAASEEQHIKELLPGATVYRTPLPAGINATEAGHPLSAQEARQRLGLDPAEPVALFFGFVRPYKGLRFLLQAMPQVLAQMDMHLLIVGEFWHGKREYQEIIDRLELSKSITVIDRYVPDEEVSIYFSAADVVVLPYVSVTQSAVVPMAYGFGKPVITTAVGNLPDVVHHQETGFVVPPGDAGALADALVCFFAHGWSKSMGETILSRQSELSWVTLVGMIESIAGETQGRHVEGSR